MGMCFWFLWSVCALWLNRACSVEGNREFRSFGGAFCFLLFYHPGWVKRRGRVDKTENNFANPVNQQLCGLHNHFLTDPSRGIGKNADRR